MVLFCLLGDPHGSFESLKRHAKRIQQADVILCTGDIGRADKIRAIAFRSGTKEPTKAAMKASEDQVITTATAYVQALIKAAGTKPILLVLGNVENTVTPVLKRIQTMLKRFPTVKLIDYKVLSVQGVRVVGVPYFADASWATTFCPKNTDFKKRAAKDTGKVETFLANKRYDILLTHIPPHDVLDIVNNKVVPKEWLGKNAGSKAIRKAVLKAKPRLVVCGHLHENPGAQKLGSSLVINLGEAGGSVIAL